MAGHGRARKGHGGGERGAVTGGAHPTDPHTRALKHRQRQLEVEKCLGAGGFGIVLQVRDGHG